MFVKTSHMMSTLSMFVKTSHMMSTLSMFVKTSHMMSTFVNVCEDFSHDVYFCQCL